MRPLCWELGLLLAALLLLHFFGGDLLSIEDLLKCLTMGTVAGLGMQLVLIFTVGLIVNIVRQIHNA